jgi:hypothetical protein
MTLAFPEKQRVATELPCSRRLYGTVEVVNPFLGP